MKRKKALALMLAATMSIGTMAGSTVNVCAQSSLTYTEEQMNAALDAFNLDELDGEQLYQAALLYREKGDFETGLTFMKAAFARGCDNALVEVAAWYFGNNIALEEGQDTNEEAIKLMNLAMERDNGMAAYYWGLIYSGGNIPGVPNNNPGAGDKMCVGEDVVERDIEKGLEYFKLSIELGYGKAYKQLGNMYFNGENGTEVDQETGASYYKMGAEAEDFTCTHLYADCLYEGIGVEQDVEKAMELYQWLVDVQAHNKNDYAWGAYMLGKIYDEGTYVERDETKAKENYELAASLGNEEAQAALDAM